MIRGQPVIIVAVSTPHTPTVVQVLIVYGKFICTSYSYMMAVSGLQGIHEWLIM